MDYNEKERFETVIDGITERLSHIILDIINMSLDKINENNRAYRAYHEDELIESEPDIDF